MLSNIRNFSKTLFAKILLVIIIIPFVFWGMGGMFNSGNSNNIAKVNNYSISTQDFMNYLNNANLDSELIKKNINNNVIEELLSKLISEKLIEMEIQNLNISISDRSLVNRIKKDKNFLDDGGLFSRIKYEKFLLSQNLSATIFEKKIKDNELKKKLFSYVSGGIKSPLFITNNIFKEQTGKIEISYINLDKNYKKENAFSDFEIKSYISANSDKFKEDYIDFSYAKITPMNLIGSNEFNELFFKKIDEMENKISNGFDFNTIVKEFKLEQLSKKNYIINNNDDAIVKKIYKNRLEENIKLSDENDFYLIYKIKKINKILPNFKNKNFVKKIRKILYEANKYEFNQNLFTQIIEKKIIKSDFVKMSDEIENTVINSIKDNTIFTIDSIKLLYSLPINSYTLISDNKRNVYLALIKNINKLDIKENSSEFNTYYKQSNIRMRDAIYSSYDLLISEKYKVTVNNKTLDRVKNYFK